MVKEWEYVWGGFVKTRIYHNIDIFATYFTNLISGCNIDSTYRERYVKDMDLIHKRPTLSKELGMEVDEIREGYCRVEMPLEEKHMNLFGGVHGGAIFALADTAAGMASRSYGKSAVTLSANMNFLAGAPEGAKTLYAEATVVRQGRTIIVMDVLVYGEERLMANGSITFYVKDR